MKVLVSICVVILISAVALFVSAVLLGAAIFYQQNRRIQKISDAQGNLYIASKLEKSNEQ